MRSAGTGERNALRPKFVTKRLAQLSSYALQVASCVSFASCAGVVTAQLATASALVINWSAFKSCTSRVLESTVKPSTRESLNTWATGAALSPNRSAIDAANSRALRRRSTRGPGLAGAAQAVSAGSEVGGGGVV